MCSIFGYYGTKLTLEKLKASFNKTISRGPDMSRMTATGHGLLGFHRLSIMGLSENGMQPFKKDDCQVVCNGEIYDFRILKSNLEKEGYTFISGSDCELLLPLYEKYGTDMFNMLDAEYALIIWDSHSSQLIAARDPLGIRPLYYGFPADGEILFASEAKNLIDLCKEIKPFPPGHYYKDGEFICYRDLSLVKNVCYDSIETACKKINTKLTEGIKKRLDSDAPVGFLLSGGLDSSLVCTIAAELSDKPIRTFAIGMDTDAIDLKYAREVAQFIGAEHTEVFMNRDDVISVLPELVNLLGTYDITTIRASVGMYLVCKYIHENTNIRVILTGEISDEIFGYKYTDFAPNAEEFQKEAAKRIHEIHMYDVLRADRCISVNSLEARVPFGDLDFVEYVMSLDPEIKMNHYNKGKYLLRHAFEGSYLPFDILMREKAAFSDAVGHSMVDDIKEYAEQLYSDEDYNERITKYTHAKPFTKESLLYRELFESYYPGQSQMVKDFWMPNSTWEGCNVNDPSARVLSNYGASGK